MTYNKNLNYCTLSPEGTWSGACAKHDLDYEVIRNLRKKADLELRYGIEFSSNKFISIIYYLAVRIFGRLVI